MSEPKNAFGQADETPKTPEADKIITVEVTGDVMLDGQRIPKGMQCKISVKQWRALSRHFRWIDGPKKHDPANDAHVQRADAAREAAALSNQTDLASVVKAAVEAALKASGKVAAALLLGFFLLAGLSSQAAAPSTFGTLPLPPMIVILPTNGLVTATNGIGGPGTNLAASVGLSTAQTNIWVAQTNSTSQNLPVNEIGLTKFDEVYLTIGAAPQVAGNGFTNTWFFSGTDGSLTNVNAAEIGANTGAGSLNALFSLTLSAGPGTNWLTLSTNISRNLLGSCGHLIVSATASATGGGASTNLQLEAQVKPIRSGN